MNKLTGLLLSLAAMAGVAQAEEQLLIDCGPNSNVQSGYSAYYGSGNNPTGYNPISYSAFGSTVTIDASWHASNTANARAVDRGTDDPYPSADAHFALVRDWIGTKPVDLQAGSDANMTWTITGLPAGNYSWLSYHHDNERGWPLVAVTVTDGSGVKNGTVQQTRSQSGTGQTITWEGIGKYATSIMSDGVNPIKVHFAPDISKGWDSFFAVNGFEITKLRDNGGAYDPVPVSGTVLDISTDKKTILSWLSNLDDPNVDSVISYDVYFGTENDPNMGLNTKYTVTSPTLTSPDLLFDTTYYWRVDSLVKWDTNIPNTVVKGSTWRLVTLPDDRTPEVKADADDKNVLTWVGNNTNLTGKVNNYDENDIVNVKWEIFYDNAMQLIPRTGNANLANLGVPANLMVDWIGTDNREVGDPMILTLKGLPAGTYSWKSYHHDPADQNGTFSVTVTDVNGTSAATSVTITAGATTPVRTHTATITANGTDPVVLTFDQTSDGSSDYTKSMFVMNGFELTATSGATGSLMIDFSDATTPVVADGYQGYVASHEVATTFTEQSYTAFGKTVSIKPTWSDVVSPKAVISDTTNNFNLTAQSANFKADKAGMYRVRLTATDAKQTVSNDMQVQVVADACAAAQLGVSGFAFNAYDVNKDCKMNIVDLVDFAKVWLNDISATSQIQR